MAGIAWSIAASFSLSLATLGQAEPAPEKVHRFEFAETHMGSEFKVVLYSPDAPTARRASRAAFDRIAALDASFSDYQPESELMKLCDRAGGPPVVVSPDLFTILRRSQSMFERSSGAFDVTVGPVVRLWRRARRDWKLPSPENLARARALVDSRLMTLDSNTRTVQLAKPGMKLDLGAIAKGYACDAAIAVLKAEGIDRALVAGAGDIRISGPPPDSIGWTVGIAPLEDPNAPPQLSLLLHDVAVSTSGDTERYVEIDGKRYSHIVDPKTGLGIVDRCSVSVVAPDGTTADALATAIYGLGQERGFALAETTEGCSAYMIRVTDRGKQAAETTRFRTLPRVGSGR